MLLKKFEQMQTNVESVQKVPGIYDLKFESNTHYDNFSLGTHVPQCRDIKQNELHLWLCVLALPLEQAWTLAQKCQLPRRKFSALVNYSCVILISWILAPIIFLNISRFIFQIQIPIYWCPNLGDHTFVKNNSFSVAVIFM